MRGSAVVLALDLRLLQDLRAVDAHRDGGRVHVPGREVRGPQDELGFRVGLAHGRDWQLEGVVDACAIATESVVLVGPVAKAVVCMALDDVAERAVRVAPVPLVLVIHSAFVLSYRERSGLGSVSVAIV